MVNVRLNPGVCMHCTTADLQLLRLQSAAAELYSFVSSLAKLSTYQALDLQVGDAQPLPVVARATYLHPTCVQVSCGRAVQRWWLSNVTGVLTYRIQPTAAVSQHSAVFDQGAVPNSSCSKCTSMVGPHAHVPCAARSRRCAGPAVETQVLHNHSTAVDARSNWTGLCRHTALLLLLQTDVNDVAAKLSKSKCTLPAHQLQLIEEFRNLVGSVTAAYGCCRGYSRRFS